MKQPGHRYRAVVVGCGRIGSLFNYQSLNEGFHSHAQAYREHPRTKLVGMADTDPQRLSEAGQFWKIETEPEAVPLLWRLKPDIVSICTPDATHFSIARTILLEAPPRLLFIEKPMTLRGDEAAQLLQLADRRGCAIAVNYFRRFSPAFRALSQELREGQHGEPLLALMLYSKGLFHNGTHAIDLMRFWLGEPRESKARPAAWGPDGDETYTAELSFANNNCRARLEGFDERVATVFELDFLSERSRWRFWLGGNKWEFSEVRDSPLYAGYRTYVPTGRERTDERFAQPLANCLWHAVDNLVAFLDGTASLLCTGKDGLAALNWAERLRRSQ